MEGGEGEGYGVRDKYLCEHGREGWMTRETVKGEVRKREGGRSSDIYLIGIRHVRDNTDPLVLDALISPLKPAAREEPRGIDDSVRDEWAARNTHWVKCQSEGFYTVHLSLLLVSLLLFLHLTVRWVQLLRGLLIVCAFTVTVIVGGTQHHPSPPLHHMQSTLHDLALLGD